MKTLKTAANKMGNMYNSKRTCWLLPQLRIECNEANTLSILEWWMILTDSDTLFIEKQVLKEREDESSDKPFC